MKRKNQPAHSRLIVIVLGLIALIALVYFYLSPKTEEIQSIFAADTCAPPCWFGLIPGESDYFDVEYLFRNRSDVFSFDYMDIDDEANPTRDSMNGNYSFYWRNYTGRYRQQDNSIVIIKDNLVDEIFVFAPEIITLGEVIEVLGQPDDIQYHEEQHLYLDLIYADSLFVIGFKSVSDGGCAIQSMADDYIFEYATYYSYQAATSLVEVDGMMQPRLTAYRDGMRQISAENWQAWLSSEEDMSCRAAGRLLPETITPIDFPSSP